jgi:tetratricopeptide (TPR) repeat protein
MGYHLLRTRVIALYDAQKWQEAEPLIEQLVRGYPRDPDNWRMLARTKRRLGKFIEAAAAAERARPVLNRQGEYIEALNHYEAGNRQRALELLREAIFAKGGIIRRDLLDYFPQFEPLKDDPEFRQIIGSIETSGWSREQGWAYDLKFFYDEVKRVNPEYRDKPFPEEFERRYEQLRRDIGKLCDEQIYVGMERALAVLRQGHLSLWADNTARVPNRWLPLRFYAFPDGVFIIDAADAYKNLVGSKVVTIGNIPAEEVLRRIAEVNSVDGDMEHVWAASRLAEAYLLRGTGAAGPDASAELRIEPRQGRGRTVRVPFLAEELKGRQDKLLAPPNVTAPLFLANVEKTFWHQALPEHRALYVQVNNLLDAPESSGETLSDYGGRLWTVLSAYRPTSLILDLRHNNGGTTQLYPNLLRSIVAFSRVPGNQLYVLIGRRTYSAAGNFVTDLERLADPVFVGEATSECCNLFGDPASVLLPYSRIQGEFTAVKWNLSTPGDGRREIHPELPVQLSAEHYFAGKDPALDAIFTLLGDRGSRVATNTGSR